MDLVHRHANEFCPGKEQLISLCGDKNRFRSSSQKYMATGPFSVDHRKHFVTDWLRKGWASARQLIIISTALSVGPLCASSIANYKVSSEVIRSKKSK